MSIGRDGLARPMSNSETGDRQPLSSMSKHGLSGTCSGPDVPGQLTGHSSANCHVKVVPLQATNRFSDHYALANDILAFRNH